MICENKTTTTTTTQERGIGGSESAVISISAELAARGWRVEVRGSPPDDAPMTL